MISSLRWVGIASYAMLVAAPSLAQNAPPDTASVRIAAPDTASAHVAAPVPAARPAPPAEVRTGSAPGRGGVGGSIGGSRFDLAQDYSKGSLPRFDFSGRYRYVFSHHWRFQISPGFTWSAYSKTEPAPFVDTAFPTKTTKEHYLTLMIPVSAQLQMTWGGRPWAYFLGAGPGVYRVWIENERKVLRDPESLRLHRGIYLGGTAELGVERFLKSLPNTSLEVSLAQHYVAATRDEQFPSGWNSSVGALALRVGGNYYFDPRREKEPEKLPKSSRK